MGRGAVHDAKARGCNLLLANGDLSNEAEYAALGECKSTLDAFGKLGGTRMVRPGDQPHYFVTRGNHDRAHAVNPTATTDPVLRDRFDERFHAGFEKGTAHFSVAIGTSTARYRFVGLDSNDGTTTGVLRDSELDYLDAELERGDLTIPLFHHPASATASLSGLPPAFDGLDVQDAANFRALLAKHPNTAGVYAGHTHRNNLSHVETGRVPYFEGGAVKEYPGGYTVVRLFEHGYMVNFHKTRSLEARAWSERSRGEYFGLGPAYQLGGLRDRNWVHHVDARRTTRLVTGRVAPSYDAGGLDPVGAVTD